MMQRQQSHPPGTFAVCSRCRREPHHIVSTGRAISEPIDIRDGGPGQRHALEDARCGRTTARHATLDAAIAEWGAAYAQGALPLRAVPHRRKAVGA